MQVQTAKRIRIVGAILFIIYLVMLEYLLLFAEGYGRGAQAEFRCNLVPFREIRRFLVYADVIGMPSVLINLLGNVIGFCPFGAILPVLYKRLRSGWRMIALTAGFSMAMELIQLVTRVGSFDVDDVILNTLGGAVGFLIFAACDRMRRSIWRV